MADAPHVFLTHSQTDLQFARAVYKALADRGTKVWASFSDISAGSELQTEIDSAIRSAAACLFIISPDSVTSDNCLRELKLAEEYGKRIVPVLYRPVPSESMPPALARRQWVDFSDAGRFEPSLSELLRLDLSQAAPAETAQEKLAIRLLSEGSATPQEIASTPALAELLARATLINRSYEQNFDVTFSSLLLAFLTCSDPLSRWFKSYVSEAGVDVEALLKTRKLDRAGLDRIAAQTVDASELPKPRRQTSSARSLFSAAQSFRGRVTPSVSDIPLDVRHLMGAYIYQPVGHEGDLVALKYNRPAWSNAFLGQIAQRHPVELELWKQIHRETFPSVEPVVPEEGPSPHIATDLWTLTDALGYRAYAHAIFRFMTHPQTRPPLTISVQAPWGGGKTSLMRMVQHALDPDAFAAVRQEAGQPRGEFTMKAALQEVEQWIESKTNQELPKVSRQDQRKRLTVWFNAWKYESTNQVWAGLADSIMQQVAARLPLIERERFWLRLNMKRLDVDRIRHKVYERIFRYWWRTVQGWGIAGIGAVIASAAAALLGKTKEISLMENFGLGGMGLFTVITAAFSAWQFHQAKSNVEKEPAAVSLSEYLEVPKYNAELGFVHHVEADLRLVLASVPPEYGPIVIFIDDLDRCSPVKVAQVVEAVNLFLAGDFPNCMFILGMDTEMVAAALQAAHKDMISCLPADAGIPVGWRFMDKFVQLPFLIPPAEDGDLTRYTTSLFSQQEKQAADPVADKLALEAAERITRRAGVADEARRLTEEHQLNDAQAERLKDQLEAQIVRRQLDEGIAQFNDKNSDIQRVIASATTHFRGNPRELKRFINAFRFQYFLWWAHRAQNLAGPTLDQLVRWTVLSMKWPEVVRWLRRSGGNEFQAAPGNNNKPALSTRLMLLEDISGKARDLPSWHQQALGVLRLKPETTSWLNDDDLLHFFYEESQRASSDRLSNGAGKGLW